MKILEKNELKNVKGGVYCPHCPTCYESGDCDVCFYMNGDITVVCVTVTDV